MKDNHPICNPAGIDTKSSGREQHHTFLPIPQKMARSDREILPMPRRVIHQIPLQGQGDDLLPLSLGPDQPQTMSPPLQPSCYSPAVYDYTNPVVESFYLDYTGILGSFTQVWYKALMAAHDELCNSTDPRITYGWSAEFHIDASRRKLSQERVITSELNSMKSKLRDLQHMLRTQLNEI